VGQPKENERDRGDGGLVGFEDLEVWQQAHELAVEVYKLARQFPADERFRYTDQICRASTSIPTNVAEGTGRYGKRDFKHFLYIARGSLEETKYLLLLGKDLGFVAQEDYNRLRDRCKIVGKLLNGLINSLKEKE
jgi:four helix bundle protein